MPVVIPKNRTDVKRGYRLVIREITDYTIEVEANSMSEAREIAQARIESTEYVDTDFSECYEPEVVSVIPLLTKEESKEDMARQISEILGAGDDGEDDDEDEVEIITDATVLCSFPVDQTDAKKWIECGEKACKKGSGLLCQKHWDKLFEKKT